jgi:hypothetical protein
MDTATDIGLNRTGIATSPKESKETIEFAQSHPPSSAGTVNVELGVLTEYTRTAEPVGKVPPPGPPGALTGLAKTFVAKLAGKKPEVFLDKLGERLAFERGGTRLYDALIAKCKGVSIEIPGFSIDTLVRIRNEELQHFKLLAESLRSLGADPTAMTPCANVVGVEALGFVQVVNEPRTFLTQSLDAILSIELNDNAAWETLIGLAREMGQDQMVEPFNRALSEEEVHLVC